MRWWRAANHSFYWIPRLGFVRLALAVTFSVGLLACGPPSPPPVVISFADTPVPVATIAPVTRLTNRLKRPTIARRVSLTAIPALSLPRPADASSASPAPVELAPTDPRASLPTPVAESTPPADQPVPALPSAQAISSGESSIVAADTVAQSPSVPMSTAPSPIPATPSQVLEAATMTPGDAATGAVVRDVAPTLTAAPEVTAEATFTFTPVFSTPTPSPVPAGATAVAGAPTESSSTIPGQVSEDQGLVVTTASKRSKYYYVRSDTGWHRIHSTNRVWFMSVDDLLRAFPGRTLHPARTPRAATRRRATATPTG